MTVKDLIQVTTWIVASLGGVIAAFKAINEMVAQRKLREGEKNQREQEYRWRQAALAKEILSEIFSSEECIFTMQMLDWNNRVYEIAPGKFEFVTREEILHALRVDNIEFTTKEAFVRDCFDQYLDGFQMLEHYIRINLIHFEDIKYPIEYWVEEMSNRHLRDVVERYMYEYRFFNAINFLNRFNFWQSKEDCSRNPCILKNNDQPVGEANRLSAHLTEVERTDQ